MIALINRITIKEDTPAIEAVGYVECNSTSDRKVEMVINKLINSTRFEVGADGFPYPIYKVMELRDLAALSSTDSNVNP